jgi:hypothetical protein
MRCRDDMTRVRRVSAFPGDFYFVDLKHIDVSTGHQYSLLRHTSSRVFPAGSIFSNVIHKTIIGQDVPAILSGGGYMRLRASLRLFRKPVSSTQQSSRILMKYFSDLSICC